MAVNDYYRLKLYVRVDEVLCQLNFAYKCTVDGGGSHATKNLIEAWVSGVEFQLLAAVPEGFVLAQMSAYEIYPNNGIPATEIFDEGITVGQYPDEISPANVCALIIYTTSLGTGRHNGRLYLPGIPEGIVNGRFLDASYLGGEMGDLVAALAAVISSGGYSFSPVVLMGIDGGVVVDPPTALPVISVHCQPNLAGRRRRTAREQYFV